jgi:uncharacterized protein
MTRQSDPFRSGAVSWLRRIAVFALAATLIGCAQLPSLNPPRASDRAWVHHEVEPALPHREIVSRSLYLHMRDGVKIAVDVHLPASLGEGERLPTILHASRYYRSYDIAAPLRWKFRQPNETVRRFLANGYAWVSIDARGSGASFGSRVAPWGGEELGDYTEIVDWLLRQPWSDGHVGAWGRAYDGTAAVMLLGRGHPAVRAAVAEFSLFDLYADVAYPGGIHLESFTREWERTNDVLDRNRPGPVAPGWIARVALRGVRPVDDDPKRRLLRAAVAEHEFNWKAHETAVRAQFRDDIWYFDPALRLAMFSPYGHVRGIDESGAPISLYAGWMAGAYQRGAIHQFMTLTHPGNRLVIGPWNHGGRQVATPGRSRSARFDFVADQLRFFDHHLRGIDTGIAAEPPVHYFTMVEGRWNTAAAWPPPATPRSYYFGPEAGLSGSEPREAEAYDTYRVDLDAGTGRHSRWRSVLNQGPVRYADRVERDELLLSYTTSPLEADLEVTGHPVVSLHVASSATDGTFFAYLEEVTPEGEVRLITEGHLRALHRRIRDDAPLYKSPVPHRTFHQEDAEPLTPGEVVELTFDLLPTSYRFSKGHRIRVAIAGADRDHFELPPGPPPTLKVYRDPARPSRIVLPVVD